MKTTVGRPINVTDVLSKSFSLLTHAPVLLIPQAIVLVFSLLEDLTKSGSPLSYILDIIILIISIVVSGAYPSMVQAVLGGGQVSVANSLRHASGRFLTLLVAGIIIAIIVILGFVALIVPGLILLTWYLYTVPAIMLENKGALAGMAASKAFGRDKKWSTFTLFIVYVAVAIVVAVIGAALDLASPILGRVVGSLLSVPVDAWFAVIITYTYLTYGPSSAPAPTDPFTYGVVPPAPVSQVPPAVGPAPVIPASLSSTGSFCRHCGAPIKPDSKFCSSCGQPI
jgi:zinc-ribbon domain